MAGVSPRAALLALVVLGTAACGAPTWQPPDTAVTLLDAVASLDARETDGSGPEGPDAAFSEISTLPDSDAALQDTVVSEASEAAAPSPISVSLRSVGLYIDCAVTADRQIAGLVYTNFSNPGSSVGAVAFRSGTVTLTRAGVTSEWPITLTWSTGNVVPAGQVPTGITEGVVWRLQPLASVPATAPCARCNYPLLSVSLEFMVDGDLQRLSSSPSTVFCMNAI